MKNGDVTLRSIHFVLSLSSHRRVPLVEGRSSLRAWALYLIAIAEGRCDLSPRGAINRAYLRRRLSQFLSGSSAIYERRKTLQTIDEMFSNETIVTSRRVFCTCTYFERATPCANRFFFFQFGRKYLQFAAQRALFDIYEISAGAYCRLLKI